MPYFCDFFKANVTSKKTCVIAPLGEMSQSDRGAPDQKKKPAAGRASLLVNLKLIMRFPETLS